MNVVAFGLSTVVWVVVCKDIVSSLFQTQSVKFLLELSIISTLINDNYFYMSKILLLRRKHFILIKGWVLYLYSPLVNKSVWWHLGGDIDDIYCNLEVWYVPVLLYNHREVHSVIVCIYMFVYNSYITTIAVREIGLLFCENIICSCGPTWVWWMAVKQKLEGYICYRESKGTSS